MADENKLNNILEEQEKLSSVEYLIQKINGSGIKLNLSKEQMKEILEAGKEVQKMAVKYGTNQDIQIDDENTFNGYGTYVVSVNEDNARQLGIKIASRKYGGTFYINNQPFSDFLQEKSFSPYWTNLVSDFKDNSVDKLSHSILTSDVKGNPSLEREQIALSTLLNLDLIEYKREQTFLYSVNIPDNDNTNYLLYNNPIGIEHAQKINEQLEKLGTSWRVSRNDIGKNIYFNVLSNNVFKGNQKKSSEFLKNLGYVGMQMDNANYIVFNDKDMSITDRVQFMKDVNGEVYGFAYQGQIYADEELVNSNVLAHEYTHIWDKYVQNNNPELWQHGKDILKGTSLWQEITEDKNYENLKTDDEILSECHARIVGKMAEQVLERIEREDGGLTRDRVIDWDKEVSQYITEEFNPELGNDNFKEFLSMPMKDLMDKIQISKNWFEKTPAQFQKEQEREDILTTQAAITVGTSYEEWEEMLDDNQKADEIIEKMQVNGGLSEAAIEAEMKAQEKPRADYLDADGNPHWNNEEEIDEPFDMAGYEYDEYIHSDEFIEKFGDWEKANRLEKLKEAETIVKDGTIVIDNFDYTAQIDKYEKEQNLSQLKLIGEILGDEVKGTYNNIDVNSNSIKEIKRHDTKDAAHIKSIYYIPDFLTKGTFISKEKNEDIVTHRKITEYQYLISGLNINNIDYTVKSAIAVDDVGNKYYDHKLSKIEKGNLLASLSSVSSQGKYSDFLFPQLKDKRLLQICQVAQIPYLERNSVTNKWQPTDKAVELVKAGKLYQEIDPVSGLYSMCDETKTNSFVLDFRNAYNASKMNYESKLTYENAEALIEHTPLSNFAKSQLEIKDNYVVSKDSNGIMTPREFFDNVVCELKNNKALDFENINNYLPNDKESAELTSIKNIDELNQYAKECKDIVLCSCRTCTNYNEKVDFDHVVSNTRNKFKDDIEIHKNDSELEKKQLKEKYEYFKKNAMELYKSASAEYSIELNKQQEKDKELENANRIIQEQRITIQQQKDELKKEKSYHNSKCDITVPQYDSNGNVVKDEQGNVKTATFHCTNGVDPALGKLANMYEKLKFENEQLRNQIQHQNDISPKSPSDDEWGR